MANFCPKCGEKVDSNDKFCKNCGAETLASPDVPDEQSIPEKTAIPAKTPSKYIIRDAIKAFIQIALLILFLYWAWYAYNCAVGNHLNNGDQMCQTIYQFFSSENGGGNDGGGKNQISIACQHCSPGYCWTEGACCPQSAQYYCNGYCYQSSNDAYNAGCHQSNWTRWCCQ